MKRLTSGVRVFAASREFYSRISLLLTRVDLAYISSISIPPKEAALCILSRFGLLPFFIL
ncbi:MAG TPA: hypothetical protein VN939_10080 [Chthoniobacterales bacterium]|nr:hypothetical protein [Chthoniobacterales bacterium]